MRPYFYSLQEFLAMGKHGSFVWSSWFITILCVAGFIIYSVYQRRQLIQSLKMQQTRRHQRSKVKQKN